MEPEVSCVGHLLVDGCRSRISSKRDKRAFDLGLDGFRLMPVLVPVLAKLRS